ncbi:hypothetical protein [Myroides odoratus]|uniref:Uncharacterized protein n=1 Tax=Myroides odoratus TaxID=256 RepID=A0A9Q7E7K0_MYROD|nr:hypothetical protein [Myroides odoratus]EHQ41251.1 hypothetical protein Myrod_0414 [Myroides odoratus DSM 2801]EKB08522.1 hypothetical protein HMPREF9716_00929 [Myroides odoratus CIP 103059]QQT98697.1 hypothetical protein I6I88_10730 [Myroides odoratus]WQD59128.1 hypothetical protein U0010_08245 [Myroides odoratus]STZ32290.1 Uncharacterised protein [Myroides odoratus]
MKKEILDRISQLGGDISQVKGQTILDDLLSITFNTVLYKRPVDTPWAKAEEEEPIFGLGEFIEEHQELVETNREALFQKIITHFYQNTEEAYGQTFWQPVLFTPFKEGTADYDNWYEGYFDDETLVDLSEVEKVTGTQTGDFLQLFYSYGFPDQLYISLDDPEKENPTVFGTDHEVFFGEITNEGALEAYFNQFMTRDELIEIVAKALDKQQNK